jgi:hypothetical protein
VVVCAELLEVGFVSVDLLSNKREYKREKTSKRESDGHGRDDRTVHKAGLGPLFVLRQLESSA